MSKKKTAKELDQALQQAGPEFLGLEEAFKAKGEAFALAFIAVKLHQFQEWRDEAYEFEIRDGIKSKYLFRAPLLILLVLILWRVW